MCKHIQTLIYDLCNKVKYLHKSYIKMKEELHIAFIHKINEYFYLQENVKVNGKWKHQMIAKFGRQKPTIWRPQLIWDKAENVLAKLPDESIDLIVIDPPYGIGFKGNRYRNIDYEQIYNDHSLNFLEGIGEEFERVLVSHGRCYIFTRWDVYPSMLRFFIDHLDMNTVLIWDKGEGGHGMGDIENWAPRYEMIMSMSKDSPRPLNGKRLPNVIQYQDVRFTGEPKVHPTQKPRGLLEILIETSSNVGDVVADFFGGSYSVPRAAQRTFRQSMGAELIPEIHHQAVGLVNRDLHNDPVYGVDWEKVTNIDIKQTEAI